MRSWRAAVNCNATNSIVTFAENVFGLIRVTLYEGAYQTSWSLESISHPVSCLTSWTGTDLLGCAQSPVIIAHAPRVRGRLHFALSIVVAFDVAFNPN